MRIRIRRVGRLRQAAAYTLTSASALPVAAPAIAAVGTSAFVYGMPARSVSTVVFWSRLLALASRRARSAWKPTIASSAASGSPFP